MMYYTGFQPTGVIVNDCAPLAFTFLLVCLPQAQECLKWTDQNFSLHRALLPGQLPISLSQCHVQPCGAQVIGHSQFKGRSGTLGYSKTSEVSPLYSEVVKTFP